MTQWNRLKIPHQQPKELHMTTGHSNTRASIAIFTTIMTILLSAPSAAGEFVTETRPVNGPVSKIRLEGPIDMSMSQGETRGIVLEGKAEELAKIEVDVTDGELTVRYEQSSTGWMNYPNQRAPRATIALPMLSKATVVGSGDIAMAPFNLNEGKLEIEIKGSGDVKVSTLKAKALAVSIRGSGDVSVVGQVSSQDIAIAGSGDYRGDELQSQTAAIAIKGSGDAKVWATDTLAVSIAGSGDVAYRGQPKVSQSIAGSGDVSQIR
jgi:Putative auto-transporter adhesin, head GIN domain